ncbi:hypothetical protein KFK09_018035 [Dendrobium nobile]|uniref:Senescence regulator n=1 Tax=Dendrobium nobile TaxID=94219 RepID=A0A8T3AUP2_DENNO|nr:hypothetical protein KFK09_018035 [Dendrobium nobile]
MAEDGTIAVSLPSSPYSKNASPFSSSFRFLGFADHPNSSPIPGNHHELDEGDVVWSPDIYSDLSAVIEQPTPTIPSSPISDSSPVSPCDRRSRPFLSEKLGLAVALTEDRRPLMHHRRSVANVPMRKRLPAAVSEVFHQSAPVNVPVWPKGRRMPSGMLMEVVDGEVEDDPEDEMLPPHVIVARSHVTTFSVFEGVGRTLKGRDLCRVRNAVFQKTGFLD